METRREFQKRIKQMIQTIDPEILSYNEDEFWMIRSVYEYIEIYAVENRLQNTLIALELARGLHDGGHRKLTVTKDGKAYRLPYAIHPLSVCRMLIDLDIGYAKEEEDIVLAAALCHDMIEDIDFPNHGKELYEVFGLDKRVYETVLYLSKRYDFTEEQEEAFFHNIESHEFALFVKLADRGNNVEDLYNMKVEKVYEYVGETNRFFIPMCDYGIEHYHNHHTSLGVLKDKIISLTEAAEILVIRYEMQEQHLQLRLEHLRQENEMLRRQWQELWGGK